jgi:LPXTG-motif cell wall-anchored protein
MKKKIISFVTAVSLVGLLGSSVFAEDTTPNATPTTTLEATVTPEVTPTAIVTPETTATPEVTATVSNTPTATPEVTNSATATPVATSTVTNNTTTNYTTTTNNYHYYYSYSKVDNRNYSTNITVNNHNINYGKQIIAQGGIATVNTTLINGGTFTQNIKIAEGKNVIQFKKNGHNYRSEFYVYGSDQEIKHVRTKNVYLLSQNTKGTGNSKTNVVGTSVVTSTLPQSEVVTTLPTTGESFPTASVAGGILIMLVGLGFVFKNKILN